MTAPLRVALDGTPLLGPRTGIGTYTEHLVRELAAREDVVLTVTAFSGRARRPADLPRGVAWRHLPVPAGVLRSAWLRSPLPRVEWLVGPGDVFHGTNFVLPPGRATGVVTVHDLSYERFPDLVSAASRQYRTLVPRGLRHAGAVLTPSAAVRDEVVAHYRVPEDRVHVTALGVAPDWAVAHPLAADRRRALGVPDDYLLFLGTREPRKNLPTLLAAHRAATAEGSAPPLVLVGAEGWGDLAPGPATLMLPHLARPEVQGLVAGARALVMPSLYEGFGLPVLEAMSAGTAVVCSDIPVLREVAGAHARFVPPTDADAWADALATVVHALPAEAAAARDRAAAFTWGRFADATVAAYRSAAA